MQHEIHEPLPLLRSDGRLTEPGWARQLTGSIGAAAVPASSWRIKEWDYYAVVSPEGFAFSLTASNLGYAGLYALCVVDLNLGRFWQLDRLQALPLARHACPQDAAAAASTFATAPRACTSSASTASTGCASPASAWPARRARA